MPRVPLSPQALLVAAVTVAGACGNAACQAPASDRAATGDSVRGHVVRVVDGDTVIVESERGEIERVRLLGIDSPESVEPGTPPECGAAQAAASLRSRARRGAAVRLRTDPASGDVYDGYGRLLAFVSLGGVDIGLEQVRRGWARVYAYRNRRFAGRERYERTFRRADHRGRGVHGLCGSDFHGRL